MPPKMVEISKVRLVGGAGSGMIYVAMGTGASASRPVIFLKMALFIMLIRLFLWRQDSVLISTVLYRSMILMS